MHSHIGVTLGLVAGVHGIYIPPHYSNPAHHHINGTVLNGTHILPFIPQPRHLDGTVFNGTGVVPVNISHPEPYHHSFRRNGHRAVGGDAENTIERALLLTPATPSSEFHSELAPISTEIPAGSAVVVKNEGGMLVITPSSKHTPIGAPVGPGSPITDPIIDTFHIFELPDLGQCLKGIIDPGFDIGSANCTDTFEKAVDIQETAGHPQEIGRAGPWQPQWPWVRRS